MTVAAIGWTATAVFATSYLSTRVQTLTKIQAVAACLWIAYGVKLGAMPVIAANLIVAAAALVSSFRGTRKEPSPSLPIEEPEHP